MGLNCGWIRLELKGIEICALLSVILVVTI